MKSALKWLFFCLLLVSTLAFPMYLTNTHCYKKMIVGEMMMGYNVVQGDDVNVQIWRANDDGEKVQLSSGDTYNAGEELIVKVKSITGQPIRQYTLEVHNAIFEGGGCGGTRIENGKPSKLRVPTNLRNEEKQEEGEAEQGVITVTAVWAKKYGLVSLTKPFFLRPPRHGSEEL